MKQYPEERKQAVLKRMMPPENTPVSVLVEETGISDVTLYHWRKQARAKRVGSARRWEESGELVAGR